MTQVSIATEHSTSTKVSNDFGIPSALSFLAFFAYQTYCILFQIKLYEITQNYNNYITACISAHKLALIEKFNGKCVWPQCASDREISTAARAKNKVH